MPVSPTRTYELVPCELQRKLSHHVVPLIRKHRCSNTVTVMFRNRIARKQETEFTLSVNSTLGQTNRCHGNSTNQPLCGQTYLIWYSTTKSYASVQITKLMETTQLVPYKLKVRLRANPILQQNSTLWRCKTFQTQHCPLDDRENPKTDWIFTQKHNCIHMF